MSEVKKQVEAALEFYADPNRWPNMPNPANPHCDMEMDAGTRARDALKALKRSQALDELVAISQEAGLYDDPPLSHPAPDVPGAEEVEAIRARHEACNFTVTKTEWQERAAFDAHTDRATLLRLLDAAREELREGGWRYDMEMAPKDGTYILAIVRQTDDQHMGRQAGRVFCIRYERFGDKYGGWEVYPGYGGAPDSFFTAWRRIDVPPTRAQGESS